MAIVIMTIIGTFVGFGCGIMYAKTLELRRKQAQRKRDAKGLNQWDCRCR